MLYCGFCFGGRGIASPGSAARHALGERSAEEHCAAVPGPGPLHSSSDGLSGGHHSMAAKLLEELGRASATRRKRLRI